MRKSDTRCESKQECSSSKADELKVEFSAEWLRIWRYERGISVSVLYCGGYFPAPSSNNMQQFVMIWTQTLWLKALVNIVFS